MKNDASEEKGEMARLVREFLGLEKRQRNKEIF